jgi:hypothetical protein
MEKLLTVVKQQLEAASAHPLHSLRLQNHMYGCFLVMEDIAERVLYVTEEDVLKGEHLSISPAEMCSQIGFRYGFLMDHRAQLDDRDASLAEYRDAWWDWFRVIDTHHDLSEVDATENAINELLRTVVPSHLAFFVNASESGVLSQEWISRFLEWVTPSSPPSPPSPPIVSALATAQTETPLHRPRRRLARTRRAPSVSASVSASATPSVRRALAKTRANRRGA